GRGGSCGGHRSRGADRRGAVVGAGTHRATDRRQGRGSWHHRPDALPQAGCKQRPRALTGQGFFDRPLTMNQRASAHAPLPPGACARTPMAGVTTAETLAWEVTRAVSEPMDADGPRPSGYVGFVLADD